MNKIYLTRTLLIAFAYFVAGNVSFALSPENGIVTVVIFSAEGIALASAIIYGRQVWVAVLLGQFFLAYYHGMAWEPSLGVAMVNSIEAIFAVILFRKFKLNKNLSTFRDALWIILIIGLILQPFSSMLSNLILVIFEVIESISYTQSSLFWLIGNSMGQLLIAPMILLLYANIKKKEDAFPLFMVATLSILLSYLFLGVYPITNPLLLLGFTIFLTLFLSYKMGVHYGTFATFIVASVSLYLTQKGSGIFVEGSPIDNIINLNSYFLFQILLVLLFGTLL